MIATVFAMARNVIVIIHHTIKVEMVHTNVEKIVIHRHKIKHVWPSIIRAEVNHNNSSKKTVRVSQLSNSTISSHSTISSQSTISSFQPLQASKSSPCCTTYRTNEQPKPP